MAPQMGWLKTMIGSVQVKTFSHVSGDGVPRFLRNRNHLVLIKTLLLEQVVGVR